MAEIINGKIVSEKIRADIRCEVQKLKATAGIIPGLAVIVVGGDPASAVYVRNKHKACLDVGIESYQIQYPDGISEEELLRKIDELNLDDRVNGILVQLPLPDNISEKRVIERISPEKDVDAFHPINVGRITVGNYDFLPCTPAGIISLLDYYGIEICGKRCVVIGRSNIVGKPMALLMTERNATVTLCHSRTLNLDAICREADIIIVAIGKAEFLRADMVKDGAVVIDVGINRMENGKLVGDVAFDEVSAKASMITPVPGGVGPMTITTLLKNTLLAAKLHIMGHI
ncbi:MAG: bifunctional methylenetetrahydrofolate dehydrogenase/methenyltetrahydrofolate cyclohydrolase FolD [Clostridia bacterium]|nr:bifunctional methylenetetrahydrofolate dehydrogenase/methenyltetrahydrofolate cyclohydrolase FolD [Clostridia bacterium]